MKRKRIAITLVLLLAVSLTACATAGNAAGGPRGGVQTGAAGSQTGTQGGDAGVPGETISPEQAQNIALEHAGFTADQVKGLRAEYDVDDGVPEYDVEFREGHWEYEYEIHAETGEIRSYDRDD